MIQQPRKQIDRKSSTQKNRSAGVGGFFFHWNTLVDAPPAVAWSAPAPPASACPAPGPSSIRLGGPPCPRTRTFRSRSRPAAPPPPAQDAPSAPGRCRVSGGTLSRVGNGWPSVPYHGNIPVDDLSGVVVCLLGQPLGSRSEESLSL